MTPEPRVVICLLLDGDGLVKTTRFRDPRYIGDPVNVISIFNRLEFDEVVLLDITASRMGRRPAFAMLERIAEECTGPLAYGGGIGDVDDARRVIEIGVEKVVINSRAAEDPGLIGRLAGAFGSQAVMASIDAKRGPWGRYHVRTHGGTRALRVDPAAYAAQMAAAGAGEILINSIDQDGTMAGFDLELIGRVAAAVPVPVIACGGAQSRADLLGPIHIGAAAVAAGSLFVYQGKGRGVLINYPSRQERKAIHACSSPS